MDDNKEKKQGETSQIPKHSFFRSVSYDVNNKKPLNKKVQWIKFTVVLILYLLFLLWVGVVEAKVTHAAIFLRQFEVKPDTFGMADVQVAVGFRGKAHSYPGLVLHALRMVLRIARAPAPFAPRIDALFEVVLDYVT